jgi:hypothetical protein
MEYSERQADSRPTEYALEYRDVADLILEVTPSNGDYGSVIFGAVRFDLRDRIG